MAGGKKNKKQEVEISLPGSFSFSRIPWNYILLFLFLIIGFSLRNYHINYPVIGYHNWKSAHYITEARNFAREGFFEEGFFVPMRDTMNSIDEPADGAHHDTFPTTPIIVAVFFKIFGESLNVARAVNILFSLASVLAMYYLLRELFEKESIALLGAFLSAINPMYVFFSHNVDVINPALFFMLAGCYYYVRWLKEDLKNPLHIYLATAFIIFGGLTKYTFMVAAIPILFTFPYKRLLKEKEKHFKTLIICGLLSLLFPAWLFYSELYLNPKFFGDSAGDKSILSVIEIGIVTDKAFWQTMKAYIADNFTLFGFNLAVLGTALFIFLFSKNKARLGYRFMLGYLIGLIAFFFIMGLKLSGHNYHQFPIAPLIIFFMAFFIEVLAKNISNFFKAESAGKATYIGIVMILLFAPLSQGKSLASWPTRDLEYFKMPKLGILGHDEDSRNRMFDTQFPGLDVAGGYIREHSMPNERVMHSSGQSFGVLWHSDRKGYKPGGTPEYIMRAEQDYNVSWIFVYNWGRETFCILPRRECDSSERARGDYIRDNYRLVQFAFMPVDQQTVEPIYLLFRKGGSFDEAKINELLQGKQQYSTTYYLTAGSYPLMHINVEE